MNAAASGASLLCHTSTPAAVAHHGLEELDIRVEPACGDVTTIHGDRDRVLGEWNGVVVEDILICNAKKRRKYVVSFYKM